ncbi:hypothetical protein C8Q70DRAFT_949057 [Cubamyces menziesii]|nr:hypothetical protein C8Q70DRAFT_949057 [Cubamyces menziesii]
MIPLACAPWESQSTALRWASIDNLPNELILLFLYLLDAQDLVSHRQVCHRWRELIDTDTALRYTVELWANDMIDGLPSGIGVEKRLRGLRDYRMRWENRHFLYDSSVEFDRRDATWFIETPSTDGSVVYRVHGDNFLGLVIVSPPSALRHVDRRVWTVPLSDIPGTIIPGIVTDLEQELVMVTAHPPGSQDITIHFLSLKGAGESHPEAVSPVTPQAPPELQMPYSLSIRYPQICGQHAAWFFSGMSVDHHSCQIEVWDWKAGELIWTHAFENHVVFSFLDPFHIVVVGKASNPPRSLCVYRIITCNARPTPGTSIRLRNVPFDHDPASALVTIRFCVFHDGVNTLFMLLVPARTLYREIEAASSCPTKINPSTVPWGEWGSRGSLLLPLTDYSRQNYLSLIHRGEPFGTRFALPFHIPQEPRGLEHVVLLDFTQGAGRCERADSAALGLMRHALLDPEDWKEIFAESVVQSTLPYRAIVGPDVTLADCQATRSVSVRMVTQPDGFAVMYARSRRDGGPRLDMYYI